MQMGKYMRKTKLSGEVAVMEVAAHQPSLGVCTRARALAAAAAAARDSSLAYLELRSRRLEKPPPPAPASKTRDPPRESHKSNTSSKLGSQKASRAPTSDSGSVGSARMRRCSGKCEDALPDVAISSGENVLESEPRERESTPCSSIRDSETIGMPGSTTRSTYSTVAKWRMQNPMCPNIPAQEMEEFFVGLEKLQQQIFIEKYNFDPVNELPLPGRYEWVELDF